jgi:hypothetical protein
MAVAHFRGQGNEAANTEFYNSKLGLPYIPDGGQVTTSEVDDTIRNYTKRDERPERGGDRLICMGVDQGKVNHCVVVEYFLSRGLDTNASAFAKVLWEGKVPGDDFDYLDRLMQEWQVLACVIDADPQINDATRFAKRFPGHVYLCRYRRGTTGSEIKLTGEDSGAPMATVGRTNWMDASLGRFHSDRIVLPADVSNEFQTHIKNVVRTYEYDDNDNASAVYMNIGPDHFAHALNYAEIALPMAAGVVTSGDITDKVL